MHTARLPTIPASVATKCQYWWGVASPQVNKFEQVSGDSHQISLAGGLGWEVPCPTSGGGQGQAWGVSGPMSGGGAGPEQGGSLYSEVQCIMGNGHIGPSVDRQPERQTQLKTLPSRNSGNIYTLNTIVIVKFRQIISRKGVKFAHDNIKKNPVFVFSKRIISNFNDICNFMYNKRKSFKSKNSN